MSLEGGLFKGDSMIIQKLIFKKLGLNVMVTTAKCKNLPWSDQAQPRRDLLSILARKHKLNSKLRKRGDNRPRTNFLTYNNEARSAYVLYCALRTRERSTTEKQMRKIFRT